MRTGYYARRNTSSGESAVADRALILVKGSTVYEGSTAELRAQPELRVKYLACKVAAISIRFGQHEMAELEEPVSSAAWVSSVPFFACRDCPLPFSCLGAISMIAWYSRRDAFPPSLSCR